MKGLVIKITPLNFVNWVWHSQMDMNQHITITNPTMIYFIQPWSVIMMVMSVSQLVGVRFVLLSGYDGHQR